MKHKAAFITLLTGIALSCTKADFSTDSKKVKNEGDKDEPGSRVTDDTDLDRLGNAGGPTPDEIFDGFFGDNDNSDPKDGNSSNDSEGSGNGNIGGTDSAGNTAGGLLELGEGEVSVRAPRFGLLVNDLTCGMCHLQINADIASIRTVDALHTNSKAKVNGSWFIHGEHKGRDGTGVTIDITKREMLNYEGTEMPNDVDADGDPDFPQFSVSKIENKMNGKVQSDSETFTKVHDGDLVLKGTKSSPIKVVGEVLVKGDLVISGYYTGVANIYVSGNVFIPADLKATKSPFPYGSSPKKEARQAVEDKMDALAIASKKTIVVGDFEDREGIENSSPFDHTLTPVHLKIEPLGLRKLYDWYPGGRKAYEKLFKSSPLSCIGEQGNKDNRSVSIVDAFLYAEKAIGGRSSQNSIAINGGIIADSFHVITGAMHCDADNHPVHKMPANWNYVNYDHRLQQGLHLLKQMDVYFAN